MLLVTTRPLSPNDEAILRNRLANTRTELRLAALMGMLLLAIGSCLWWGEPNVCLTIGLGFGLLIMGISIVQLVASGSRERPRLWRALQSTHVVEYQVATHVVCRPSSGEFVLFDIGDGRLFAMCNPGWNWWSMFRASFRLVIAKPMGLELERTEFGISWFRPRKVPAFNKLVPDKATRERILSRLREQPIIRGSLDDLPAALLALGQVEPPPPVADVPPVWPDWDAVQCYLEEHFGHEFGVGRLAVAMAALPQPVTPMAAAEVVLNFFPDPALAAPANQNRRRLLRQLREALAIAIHRPPNTIRPTDRLEELFPAKGRPAAWETFRQAFGPWQTPRARTDPPWWIGHAVIVAVIASVYLGVRHTRLVTRQGFEWAYFSWAIDFPTVYTLLIIIGSPLVAMVGSYAMIRSVPRLFVRFRFPTGMTTVNDLLQHALETAGEGYQAPIPTRPARSEVEAVIRDRWSAPLEHANRRDEAEEAMDELGPVED